MTWSVSDRDLTDEMNGMFDGLAAHFYFVMVVFICNFEPKTLRAGRLCPQRNLFAHDSEEQQWVCAHRCHEVLVYSFAMIGSLYGIELEESVNVARMVLVFSNRMPFDGRSDWTKPRVLPNSFKKIAKITDKIMRCAFETLPRQFPNLEGVCLFGQHTHKARNDGIIPTDLPIVNDTAVPHPGCLVAPWANVHDAMKLFTIFSRIWANLLGTEVIIPREDFVSRTMSVSRRTGASFYCNRSDIATPGGETIGYYDLLDFYYEEATGTEGKKLDLVRDKFGDKARQAMESMLKSRAVWSFERKYKPYLQERKGDELSNLFVSSSISERRIVEFRRLYDWVNMLRQRIVDGTLRSGEDAIIKSLKELDVPMEEEEVRNVKDAVRRTNLGNKRAKRDARRHGMSRG